MITLPVDLIAAFTQRGIAGALIRRVAVDQHVVKARFHAVGRLLPAHELRRRAGARAVGRLSGQPGGEIAAAFRHNAEAAEGEDLERHRRFARQLLHLMQRQHARQHHAAQRKVTMVEAHRLQIGGGGLHRQMTFNLGIALRGVLQRGDIGKDQRVRAVLRRHVDGALPAVHAVRMSEGINGDM